MKVDTAVLQHAIERSFETGSIDRDAVHEVIALLDHGRVRVAVPAGDQVGYRFDLETLEGRIALALEDIRSVFHEAPGRGGLRAETFQFDERPERVHIRVRSRNGSIAVEAGSL